MASNDTGAMSSNSDWRQLMTNPSFGDFIRSIGVGILSTGDVFKGIGVGSQTFQANQVRKEAQNAEQAWRDKQMEMDQDRLAQNQKQFDASFQQNADLAGQKADLTRQGWQHDNDLEGIRAQNDMDKLRAQIAGQIKVAQSKPAHQNGYQMGDPVYDEQGNMYIPQFNRDTGHMQYLNGNGQVGMPQGQVFRGQDSPYKNFGQAEGADYKTVTDMGTRAQQVRPKLAYALDTLNSNPELMTGTGANAVQFFKKMAVSFGAAPSQVENVADAEVLSQVATEAALNYVNQTKGAISDKEMATFSQAAPGLTHTREGNKQLLGMAIKIADRQNEMAQYYANHIRSDGYAKTRQGWQDYINDNPVFGDMPNAGPNTLGLSQSDNDLINKYLGK